MYLRPKVAVVGHSFTKRIERDIRNVRLSDLKRNFGLSQCDIKFRWSGRWEILEVERFSGVIAPFLQDFHPDIVVLQLGGNDIDSNGDVQTLSVAGGLEDLATWLINTFGVTPVFIGEIFNRGRPRNIGFNVYEEWRKATLNFLSTVVEHISRFKITR